MAFQVFPAHPPCFGDGGYRPTLVATDTGDAKTYGAARGRCEPRIFVPNRERQDHGSTGNRHSPMMTPDDAA